MPLDAAGMYREALIPRSSHGPAVLRRWQLDPRRQWARDAYTNALARSRRKGFSKFLLTREWLAVNAPVVCPALGLPLRYGSSSTQGPRVDSPTVDRVDNGLGYVTGNVVIVSGRANSMKCALSLPDMRAIAATRVEADVDDFSRLVRFYAALRPHDNA